MKVLDLFSSWTKLGDEGSDGGGDAGGSDGGDDGEDDAGGSDGGSDEGGSDRGGSSDGGEARGSDREGDARGSDGGSDIEGINVIASVVECGVTGKKSLLYDDGVHCISSAAKADECACLLGDECSICTLEESSVICFLNLFSQENPTSSVFFSL